MYCYPRPDSQEAGLRSITAIYISSSNRKDTKAIMYRIIASKGAKEEIIKVIQEYINSPEGIEIIKKFIHNTINKVVDQKRNNK